MIAFSLCVGATVAVSVLVIQLFGLAASREWQDDSAGLLTLSLIVAVAALVMLCVGAGEVETLASRPSCTEAP
jgi:hypothetical protein